MNERGYAWLDAGLDHSEEDRSRAAALAKKWSSLRYEVEQEGFSRQADLEDGNCEEPDPCEVCGGDAKLGIDGPRTRRGSLANWPDWAVGIECPNADCKDGYDLKDVRLAREARKEKETERRVEMDIVEEMLARLGARVMRPYEHWGEEESRIQYAEDARFEN